MILFAFVLKKCGGNCCVMFSSRRAVRFGLWRTDASYWDLVVVASCSLVDGWQRFGGICCFHLQGQAGNWFFISFQNVSTVLHDVVARVRGWVVVIFLFLAHQNSGSCMMNSARSTDCRVVSCRVVSCRVSWYHFLLPLLLTLLLAYNTSTLTSYIFFSSTPHFFLPEI
jgi:hypothetical protein